MNPKVKNAPEPPKKIHKNIIAVNEQRKYGCKTHGDDHLIEDVSSGDMICTKCAVVVEERMICDEAEWRCYDGDTQSEKWAKSRIGGTENPLLSADYNLGTMVKNMDRNSTKSSFSSNIVNQYKRRSVDNALSHAFKEIDTIGERMGLPLMILQQAKVYYQKLYHHMKFKGNILFIDSKTAACLYIACRTENAYRSTGEIAGCYDVKRSALQQAITRAKNALGLKMPHAPGALMIDRYSGYFAMARNVSKRARHIADYIDYRELNKKLSPEYVAATSMYLAISSTQGRRSNPSVICHKNKCSNILIIKYSNIC